MVSKIKRNYKLGIAFILGILISGLGVYAATSIGSDKVSYDNSKSGISATTMQQALDELYEKAARKCKVVEGDKNTVGSTVNCGGEMFYISTVGTTTTLIAKSGLNSLYIQSITPTPVNYAAATSYIENYVNTTLSWLKGNLIFYGHTTYDEIIKLSTGTTSGRYNGPMLNIGGGYWLTSGKIFVNSGPGYEILSVSDDVDSYTIHTSSTSIYVRPMICISSSIIQ